MARQFVIVMEQGTKEEQDDVSRHLKSKGWRFWHWMENVWLLAEIPDDIDANTIYWDLAKRSLLADKLMLVLWAGPVGDARVDAICSGLLNRRAWPWLRKHWDPGLAWGKGKRKEG